MYNKEEKLKEFQEIFLKKNKVINLISKNDEKFIYEKHIFDSLSIKLFFEKYKKNYKNLLDIGTGGGFPSIPIAIMYPNLQVFGLDSIRKKVNSIREFVKELDLKNYIPLCERAENIKEKNFDLITSRAVGKLELVVKYALPLLAKNGYIVIYKSKLVTDEINQAQQILNKMNAKVIDVIKYNLPTDEIFERNLVVIKNVK